MGIVLKHYFQPGREDFRKALEKAMPELLTGEKAKTLKTEKLKSEDDRKMLELIAEIVAKATEETAWEDLKKIGEILKS